MENKAQDDDLVMNLVELALHRVEIADDDGEQIVEVVRDAAAELTHGLHLHRLAEGRLRLAAELRFFLELAGSI